MLSFFLSFFPSFFLLFVCWRTHCMDFKQNKAGLKMTFRFNSRLFTTTLLEVPCGVSLKTIKSSHLEKKKSFVYPWGLTNTEYISFPPFTFAEIKVLNCYCHCLLWLYWHIAAFLSCQRRLCSVCRWKSVKPLTRISITSSVNTVQPEKLPRTHLKVKGVRK